MGYIKQGKYMLAWGTVGKNVNYRDFPSGKAVTNFSVRYDLEDGDGQGRKKGKYLNVDAWKEGGEHDLALYASCLEPGDSVFVAGRLERDAYQSDKKGEDVYKLNADHISVQQYADDGAFSEEDAEEEPEEAPAPPPRSSKKRESKPKPQETGYGGFDEYGDPGMVELPGDDDLPDFLR